MQLQFGPWLPCKFWYTELSGNAYKRKLCLPPLCPVTLQEHNMVSLHCLTLRYAVPEVKRYTKLFDQGKLLWGLWSTETGCPERSWILFFWRNSSAIYSRDPALAGGLDWIISWDSLQLLQSSDINLVKKQSIKGGRHKFSHRHRLFNIWCFTLAGRVGVKI